MTCCDGVRCREPLSVCLGSPRLEFLMLWRFVMGFYSLTSLEILLFRNDTDILCCVEPQHNENSLMPRVTPQFMCKHYFPQQFCWSWPFQWILLELLNTQADGVGNSENNCRTGATSLSICATAHDWIFAFALFWVNFRECSCENPRRSEIFSLVYLAAINHSKVTKIESHRDHIFPHSDGWCKPLQLLIFWVSLLLHGGGQIGKDFFFPP